MLLLITDNALSEGLYSCPSFVNVNVHLSPTCHNALSCIFVFENIVILVQKSWVEALLSSNGFIIFRMPATRSSPTADSCLHCALRMGARIFRCETYSVDDTHVGAQEFRGHAAKRERS